MSATDDTIATLKAAREVAFATAEALWERHKNTIEEARIAEGEVTEAKTVVDALDQAITRAEEAQRYTKIRAELLV